MEDSGLNPLDPRRTCCTRCGCFSSFKWFLYLVVLLFQLIGVILFTIRAADCFFRESRTAVLCEHFDIFPVPKILEILWLLISSAASLFLVIYVVYYSLGFWKILGHLWKKKYFHKINFVLLVVVIYDIYVISNDPQIDKTTTYIVFILEKLLTVVLIFSLNFLPSFWNTGEPRLKYWFYKAALVMYVIQNFIMAVLGSAIASYKVLSVPEPRPNMNNAEQPKVKSVVALILLMTNNGFRYFVADFFLSKLFDENMDVLGGKTIEESIGTQNDEGQDEPEGSHRLIPSPTHDSPNNATDA